MKPEFLSNFFPDPKLFFSLVSCEDGNKRLCNKIIKYYGVAICNTHDESLLNAIQGVCQATCGFCNTTQGKLTFIFSQQ